MQGERTQYVMNPRKYDDIKLQGEEYEKSEVEREKKRQNAKNKKIKFDATKFRTQQQCYNMIHKPLFTKSLFESGNII